MTEPPASLDEIRAYLPEAKAGRAANPQRYPADFDWAIEIIEELAAQVERLRGLLRRLEWADRHSEWGVLPHCPACQVMQPNPHDPDCWLAAAIRSTSGEEQP